jgi:hypothetical protein
MCSICLCGFIKLTQTVSPSIFQARYFLWKKS